MYITKMGQADVLMCPQCVLGFNSGSLEVKPDVDYTKTLRGASFV